MKDEIEDWIRSHCFEEDQDSSKKPNERDTRKAAGVPLGRKEVDEIFQERETMYESLAFLRQHRNTTVVEFLGRGELKMKCRADRNEVGRSGVGRRPGLTSRQRSQKETWRSGSLERLLWTWSGSCRCQGCDGPERTYKQVLWALFGADQGRRDEEYTVDLCTKCFLAGGRQQSATATDERHDCDQSKFCVVLLLK